MIDATAPYRASLRAEDLDDLDVTGVDPLRLAETRRRVASVRSYLAPP